MNAPPAEFSAETLRHSLCLGYCLCWEIAGKASLESWRKLRAVTAECHIFGPNHRRLIELYEESRPSVSEERYLARRVERLVPDHDSRKRLAKWLLSCLPDEIELSAARHPLIRDWISPPKKKGNTRLFYRTAHRKASTPEERAPAESEREEDFAQFLAMPGFEKAFEDYWHKEPKNRNNRETRGLVTIAAILSHFFPPEQFEEHSTLRVSLKADCHFSDITVDELSAIGLKLESNWYQTADLAYRLMVDTRASDRVNIDQLLKSLEDDERTTEEDRKTFHEVLDLAS